MASKSISMTVAPNSSFVMYLTLGVTIKKSLSHESEKSGNFRCGHRPRS
ncbi:Uncharacterised protein [Mycobacteroides abscessus subsp. abscessus]|nr:Uncharacterised protein [Mycobacteroides abscessus subsp. abscessus]